MGELKNRALDVCNFGARMLRLAEALEKGEVDVEGEKMPLSVEFKNKLETKYDNLKKQVSEKIKDKEK